MVQLRSIFIVERRCRRLFTMETHGRKTRGTNCQKISRHVAGLDSEHIFLELVNNGKSDSMAEIETPRYLANAHSNWVTTG